MMQPEWDKEKRDIHISTEEPTASDGKDGDVWIMYEA